MANAILYRPVRAQGKFCATDGAMCAPGLYCVDSVCCASPCSSPCQSCNQPGKLGSCRPTCNRALGCHAQPECARQVLVVHTEIEEARTYNVVSTLAAYGLEVTVVNGSLASPTRAQLAMTASVFVWTWSDFHDHDAIGNLLADFVNDGGHVVLAIHAQITPASVQGQFNAVGMHPTPLSDVKYSDGRRTLVKLIQDHPLLLGVTSFDGGTVSARPGTKVVASGAVRVADWSSGEPLISLFDDKYNGSVVSLGFYPVSSSALVNFWLNTTDGARMMVNAINYRPVRVRGKFCAATGAKCALGLFCVDSVCCDMPCSSPCQSCNQPGKLGFCLPTCNQPIGCLSPSQAECGANPVACAGRVRGWIGNTCHIFAGSDSGVCVGNVSSCLVTPFDVGVCDAFHQVIPAASCRSAECKKPSGCERGASLDLADSVAKLCFTLIDSPDADSCPGAAERCDDSGLCVADAWASGAGVEATKETTSYAYIAFVTVPIVMLVCLAVWYRARRKRGQNVAQKADSDGPSVAAAAPVQPIATSQLQYVDARQLSQRTTPNEHYVNFTVQELGM